MPSSPEYIWQDRDIKFDTSPSLLSCRKGEVIIDSINSVEDTKGNNGERGSLIVTNLRIIWVSHQNPTVNLSMLTLNPTNFSAVYRYWFQCYIQYQHKEGVLKTKGAYTSVMRDR